MIFGTRQYDPVNRGVMEVVQINPNRVEVYFLTPDHSLADAGLDPRETDKCRTKLLDIDVEGCSLTIYPINTSRHAPDFLEPKYGQIKRITLAEYDHFSALDRRVLAAEDIVEILEYLPSPFTKDYTYGLGLPKHCRFIIDAVEELSDCTEIIITNKRNTGPASNGKCFYISDKDFKRAYRLMNSIGNLAQEAVRTVRHAEAYNILAERIGVDKVEPKVGRHPYRKLFTAVAQGKKELSEKEQSVILNVMKNHAAELAEDKPEKLAKLRNDIELVTLEKLIQKFETMIGQKLVEKRWQKFFNENPFILNMAFGYPVIKVCDQASVGGRKLSGDGEKITDFLVKNSLTNNTAIFEIKTPQTPILNKKPFRGGVYTPSADLSGSVSQALDQKYQFQKQVAQIKENSKLYGIESYAVHCCLVVGQTPEGDDHKKSFELFRWNSKNVEIITFDELLEKLKQLGNFLRATEKEETS